MIEIKRILITGGSGLLGRNLVKSLTKFELELFHPSRGEVDLFDAKQVDEYVNSIKPDLIIHAAAKVGGIKANIASPLEFALDNLKLDSSVFSAALKNNVESFIYIGSSCMYPKDAQQPFQVEHLLQGGLEKTNESYALAKLMGSFLTKYTSQQTQKNYKTLILSNLYGPGDHLGEERSHLLAAVITKVSSAIDAGDEIVKIGGTGTPRREFTYVEDVTDWIAHNLDGIERWPVFMNLGNGTDYSVKEFYETAALVLGFEGRFDLDPSFSDGMPSKLMDSSVASNEFGWRAETDIQSGIAKTYEWWKNAKN